MSDDWGPWIEHDGKGCSVLGQFVHVLETNDYGRFIEYCLIAGSAGGRSWDWSNRDKFTRIIRYRVRKPRGMAILEAILADLPTKVDA